jgi:hypothetical protein
VALIFTKNNATLICSQGSDFSCFHDNGKLRADIERYGYGMNYNPKTIQKDGYNCGLFSIMAIIMFLNEYNSDKSIDDIITSVIKKIGVNGSKINHAKTIQDLREGLIGTKTWSN